MGACYQTSLASAPVEAQPIEEVLLRPAASALLVGVLPWLVARVAQAFFAEARERDSALSMPRALLASLAFGLGATALGPGLSPTRHSIAGHLFGLACVGLTLAADALVARRLGWTAPARRRELGLAVGGAVVLDAVIWAATTEPQVAVVSGALFALALVAHARDPSRRSRAGWLVGATIAGALSSAVALAAWATPIEVGEAANTSESAAEWRLRVDPWDDVAMLAYGWGASAREAPQQARARLDLARRMGVGEAPALELEAELAALAGDCDEARALFDRALRARAMAAFDEDGLAEPLLLGGYHLPPTMVTECGALESLDPSFE